MGKVGWLEAQRRNREHDKTELRGDDDFRVIGLDILPTDAPSLHRDLQMECRFSCFGRPTGLSSHSTFGGPSRVGQLPCLSR